MTNFKTEGLTPSQQKQLNAQIAYVKAYFEFSEIANCPAKYFTPPAKERALALVRASKLIDHYLYKENLKLVANLGWSIDLGDENVN